MKRRDWLKAIPGLALLPWVWKKVEARELKVQFTTLQEPSSDDLDVEVETYRFAGEWVPVTERWYQRNGFVWCEIRDKSGLVISKEQTSHRQVPFTVFRP